MVKNPDEEKNNPCLKEQKLSLKCLDKNNYNRDKCQAQFQNYQNCKDFWGSVRAARRSKGIYPYMPPVEEREKIKSDYFQNRMN